MTTQKKIHAMVLEKDEKTAEAVGEILKQRGYGLTLLSSRDEAIRLLKERPVSLAVAGEAVGSDSPFQIMKDIVMTSPLTSTILITDLPKQEVEDRAEGYGILGHVNRSGKPEEIIPLLDSFEKILGSF